VHKVNDRTRAADPLSLGADLVMHSLTKYISGHGDGMGDAVTGRQDLITRIRDADSIHLGGTISSFNAWLIACSAATRWRKVFFPLLRVMIMLQGCLGHSSTDFSKLPIFRKNNGQSSVAWYSLACSWQS